MPEQVADVAGQRHDRSLVAVEGDRRERAAGVLDPEPRPERARWRRPPTPASGRVPGDAERLEQVGATGGGRVGVALHLAQRDRRRRRGSRRCGVPRRRSPSSPGWTVRGRTRRRTPAGGHRRRRRARPARSAPAPARAAAARPGRRRPPAPRVVQGQRPQRGGVDGAVVDRGQREARRRRRRRCRSRRARTSCRILPGCSAVAGSSDGCPGAGEHAQRRPGQVGGDRQQHPRRPEAVAAEEGEEPRRPGAQELLAGRRRPSRAAAAAGRRGLVEHRAEPAVGAGHDDAAQSGRGRGAAPRRRRPRG